MKLILALVFTSCAFAQLWPFPGPGRAAVGGGGSTPPSVGTVVNGGPVSANGSGDYVLSSVTASSGDAIFVGFGGRALEATCNQVTSITSDNGSPTFVKTPSGTIGDQSLACANGWIAYGVNAGTHNLTMHGNAADTLNATYVIVPIHPGSLTSVTDATCSGVSGTTSVSCSGSMTPSTSLAFMGAFAFCWDGGTFTAGGSMTIPSNGQVNAGLGTAAFEYQILNPPSGSYTPAFTAPSGGDGVTIVGFVIK